MTTATSGRDSESFPPPVYGWYVAVVIFIANTFAFIDRIIVAILTPALQENLGITDSQAGLLQGFAFALFYALVGLPLGWIADRWSRKWLMAIGMSAWSLMTALCGMASGFGLLFLARIGVGVGEASLNPCVSSLIGDYFPPLARSRAFGLYIMGNTFGAGIAYAVGGVLLRWLNQRGGLDLLFFGHLEPWQSMFVLVGVPGLIPALLFMLTVREPARREVVNKIGKRPSVAQMRAFTVENRRTLACMYLGLALMTMTPFIFVNWLPTFFLRRFEWEPSHFSIAYGPFVLLAGLIGSTTAGLLATLLKNRGMLDGTLRGALIGGTGTTLLAALAPLMPTSQAALTCYVAASVVSTYMGVLSLAAISEIIPNEMRGVMTAVYYMLVSLLGSGLAPVAVGLVTDYVFQDRMAIGKSLIVVTLATGLPGGILVFIGLRFYRESLSRAFWATPKVT